MAKITSFLRDRFLRFRREVIVLWYAFRHPATPTWLKLVSLLLAIYLISPFDLIPIMIPFLGVVDDLIIVPLGVSFVVKRLPAEVRTESEQQATRWIGRYIKRPLLFTLGVLLVLLMIWAGLFWLLWHYWLSGLFSGA